MSQEINYPKHYTILIPGSFTFHTMETPKDSSCLIMENRDWNTLTEILESYVNGTTSQLEIPEDRVQDILDFMANHIEELNTSQ
jgi:hypothetical protein